MKAILKSIETNVLIKSSRNREPVYLFRLFYANATFAVWLKTESNTFLLYCLQFAFRFFYLGLSTKLNKHNENAVELLEPFQIWS